MHKSGQNSPKYTVAAAAGATLLQTNEDQLYAAISKLPETAYPINQQDEPTINDIILNTKITPNQYHDDNESIFDGKRTKLEMFL